MVLFYLLQQKLEYLWGCNCNYLNCRCITSGYFAFFLAAFLPEPINTGAARGFRSGVLKVCLNTIGGVDIRFRGVEYLLLQNR